MSPIIGLLPGRPTESLRSRLRRDRPDPVGRTSQIHRNPRTTEILRAAEIKPHLLDQWVMSELGPDFDAQAAEVCGLYLDPPAGTLVVSIDEKTGIQAKAPTRPDVKARPGRPSRREYEYTRNGTQTCSPRCGCTQAR